MICETGTMKFHVALLLLLVLLATGGAHAESESEAEECTDCHSLMSTRSRLRMDVEAFNDSVHAGSAQCSDCHSRLEIADGACVHGSGAVECVDCHDRKNLHGWAGTDANRPDCHHCHTRHNIFGKTDPRSSVHPDRLADTCVKCHPSQSGRVGFLSWLPSVKIATHPKADFNGQDYHDRNCIGCHQGEAAHGGQDSVNASACPRCHMGRDGGKPPMLGFSHPEADPDRQAGVFFVALIYQAVLVVFLLGGMVFFFGKFSRTKNR